MKSVGHQRKTSKCHLVRKVTSPLNSCVITKHDLNNMMSLRTVQQRKCFALSYDHLFIFPTPKSSTRSLSLSLSYCSHTAPTVIHSLKFRKHPPNCFFYFMFHFYGNLCHQELHVVTSREINKKVNKTFMLKVSLFVGVRCFCKVSA